MTPIKKAIVITICVICAVICILICAIVFFMTSIPTGEYVKSVASPDGKGKINVFINSPALSADAIRCEYEDGQTGKTRNIYFCLYEDTAKVRWLDNKTVSINYCKLNVNKDFYNWRKDSHHITEDRDKEMVLDFFDEYGRKLKKTARRLTKGIITQREAVTELCRSTIAAEEDITISDKGSIDICVDSRGIAPAGAYYGIVYLPTDDMTDFQWYSEKDKPYVQEGKGYYTDDGTDNTIYLEEFREHWYYYYVTF